MVSFPTVSESRELQTRQPLFVTEAPEINCKFLHSRVVNETLGLETETRPRHLLRWFETRHQSQSDETEAFVEMG